MAVELIGIVALAVGLASIFFGTAFITYVFFGFTLLGAAAAFVLESLGGTNISPAHLLLGFLTFKLLGNKQIFNEATQGLAFGKASFWLLLTVIYSILSAYFMPRLFMGQTDVFLVRALGQYSVPLAPIMSNVTQSIYLAGDFVCFFVLYGYASQSKGRMVLANAAFACVILNLVFGALDLATYWTNTTELLSFIRNANYSMLNDTELAGFKRIVGSFVEASSYAAATIGYFGFSAKMWLLGIRTRLSAILSALSLLALVFSTSTTAYVGLAVFLCFLYLQTVVRAMRQTITPQMTLFLAGTPILFSILAVAIALNDTSAAYVQSLLDTMVFNKMSTDSGVERSSWNRQAMQNFYDTFGFGAGIGSVRTSSFPIAVLSNLGVIGTLLFSMFFVRVLFDQSNLGSSDRLADAYVQAARCACIAWLITASISGALVDLGLPFFAFAALACSASRSPYLSPAVTRRMVR